MSAPWSDWVGLDEVARGPVERRLIADEAARRRIAETLALDELPALDAEVRVTRWLDGAQLWARWSARVVQTCGVTLEPFETEHGGEFTVQMAPQGGPAAPNSDGGEIAIDLDAPDPPDVLDSDRLDAAAYVVEHLALEIDPFPRKPDAVFEPPEAEPERSPFAALLALKPAANEP